MILFSGTPALAKVSIRGKQKPVWDRASDVTNRDRRASHVARKLSKRRAVDWLGESLTHSVVRIMQNRHCRFLQLEIWKSKIVLLRSIKPALPICEGR